MIKKTKTPVSKKDVARLIQGGQSLGQIRGIKPELREFLYHYGNSCYQRGDFASAERAFLFLSLNFHKEADFWEALGEVALLRHKHAMAQSAWTLCFMLSPTVYHGCRLMRADGLVGQPQRSIHFLPFLYNMAKKQGKAALNMLNHQCRKQERWLEKQNSSKEAPSTQPQ